MKKNTIVKVILYGFFPLAILSAVFSLFGRAFIPTHDGEYHIIRIVEFSKMLESGYLFPRWAPNLNSGYGVPVFLYNYPFPNYVGSFIRIITHDAVYAFQWSVAAGYIFVVICLFGWLSSLFSPFIAVFGTIIGAFTPYLFLDMYIRGSIGEVWAIGFALAVLWSITKRSFPLSALSFALLIVSHNILALIFTPLFVVYAWFIHKKSFLSLAVGLGLAAYFWIPALLEQQYVVGLNTVDFHEHFVQWYEFIIPSWGSAFSGSELVGGKISFQIGLSQLLIMFLFFISIKKQSDKKIRTVSLFFASVFGVALFFMTGMSRYIWEYVPLVKNIQYPWRFLSFIIPIAGFCAAAWVSLIKRPWIALGVCLFTVLITYSYTRPVLYEPRNEAYYMSRKNFTDGTSSMGNSFSTIWTGWKATRPNQLIHVYNGTLVSIDKNAYLDKRFRIKMKEEGELVTSIMFFPGWTAFIDGVKTNISHGSDGIIHITVPKGSHRVVLQFLETGVRKIADSISIISLVVLLCWGILHLYAYRSRRKPT